MRIGTFAFGLCAVAVAGLTLALTSAADAQQRNRAGYQRVAPQSTYIRVRDEDGRVRTRVVVQPRSYLDGGTEVLPGQRKYTDYISLPGQRPLDVLGPGRGYDRQPFNGPFDYGFRNW
jgi:hypothetical protein